MATLIFFMFFVKNWEDNIENKNLFCSTYFRSDFRQLWRFRKSDPLKFVEVVTNLFMKLQTCNVTKISQSGHQIGGNWIPKSNFVSNHINFLWKVIYQKAFWSLGWVDRTVLPDSLEITIFGTRSIQKSRWNSPPLTKTKTEKITLWNQATAQLIGKTQVHGPLKSSGLSSY